MLGLDPVLRSASTCALITCCMVSRASTWTPTRPHAYDVV